MEKNEAEKKPISRYILYGIATILVFFTLIQFYQVLGLQAEIAQQEEEIAEMAELKDYLKDIRLETYANWIKLMETIYYVSDMVTEGLMTELEANISISITYTPFARELTITNLFYWNATHLGGYDRVNSSWAIWNEARQGGFLFAQNMSGFLRNI
jgi:hypothetical protein